MAVFGRYVDRVARAASRAMAAALVLVLAACYESDTEIIPVELSEDVPFTRDVIVWNGNEEGTHFGRGAGGRDYRFEHHREDETNTGLIRAMRLKDDIYAVQVKDDDAAHFNVLFYRIGATAVTRMDPGTPAEIQALARRMGVQLDDPRFGYRKLAGDQAAMLAFVRAHAELEFKVFVPPPRRRP